MKGGTILCRPLFAVFVWPFLGLIIVTRKTTEGAIEDGSATRYPLPATRYPLPATRYPLEKSIFFCGWLAVEPTGAGIEKDDRFGGGDPTGLYQVLERHYGCATLGT